MAIQDDALTLLQAIAEATQGSLDPVIIEDLPEVRMSVERSKAAFKYLKGKRLIETFSLAYSARLSASGHDFLTTKATTSALPAPAPPHARSAPPKGEIIMLKPNFYGIGLDLNELVRRIGHPFRTSPGPHRALVLLPNEAQSFAHHAPQTDGRKLTQIAVRGWATNTTDRELYPTLVRVKRPFGLKATSNFIITEGPGGMFSHDNPVQPGERRAISAHFFVKGFVGKAGQPLRVVVKVCDNLGSWHVWVLPTLPNQT